MLTKALLSESLRVLPSSYKSYSHSCWKHDKLTRLNTSILSKIWGRLRDCRKCNAFHHLEVFQKQTTRNVSKLNKRLWGGRQISGKRSRHDFRQLPQLKIFAKLLVQAHVLYSIPSKSFLGCISQKLESALAQSNMVRCSVHPESRFRFSYRVSPKPNEPSAPTGSVNWHHTCFCLEEENTDLSIARPHQIIGMSDKG